MSEVTAETAAKIAGESISAALEFAVLKYDADILEAAKKGFNQIPLASKYNYNVKAAIKKHYQSLGFTIDTIPFVNDSYICWSLDDE